MPRWLVEDTTTVLFILCLIGLGMGMLAWIARRGKYAVGLGIAVLLFVLVVLLDRFIVTDREKIVEHIRTMAGNVSEKNADRIFKHISDRFHVGLLDRKAFRNWVDTRMRNADVTDLRVWDFSNAVADRETRTGSIEFLVKGRGGWQRSAEFFKCRASFVLDADGEWRMNTFELFEPQKDPKLASPLQLPF